VSLIVVINQWTVPLEWNTGMEYWNGLNCYKCLIQYRTEARTYKYVLIQLLCMLELLATLGVLNFLEFCEVKGHVCISASKNECQLYYVR